LKLERAFKLFLWVLGGGWEIGASSRFFKWIIIKTQCGHEEHVSPKNKQRKPNGLLVTNYTENCSLHFSNCSSTPHKTLLSPTTVNCSWLSCI